MINSNCVGGEVFFFFLFFFPFFKKSKTHQVLKCWLKRNNHLFWKIWPSAKYYHTHIYRKAYSKQGMKLLEIRRVLLSLLKLKDSRCVGVVYRLDDELMLTIGHAMTFIKGWRILVIKVSASFIPLDHLDG